MLEMIFIIIIRINTREWEMYFKEALKKNACIYKVTAIKYSSIITLWLPRGFQCQYQCS